MPIHVTVPNGSRVGSEMNMPIHATVPNGSRFCGEMQQYLYMTVPKGSRICAEIFHIKGTDVKPIINKLCAIPLSMALE
jgi:hypothetical protein